MQGFAFVRQALLLAAQNRIPVQDILGKKQDPVSKISRAENAV
jgi:hypothetical protein